MATEPTTNVESAEIQTQSQEDHNDQFVKHLERSSEIVKSWPIWKQQLLGGTAATSSLLSSSTPPQVAAAH